MSQMWLCYGYYEGGMIMLYDDWDDKLEEITKEEADLLLSLGIYNWQIENGKYNN